MGARCLLLGFVARLEGYPPMSERPFTKEGVRAGIWQITDRVLWGLENEFGHTGDPFVAHDAEGVVLVGAAGDRAEVLRDLLSQWSAIPEHLERPDVQADRETERS